MKFNYSFKPLDVLIRELKENNHINWFYLTDGCYNIEFNDVKLFEYTDTIVKENNMISNSLDYYVIRIVEDIFEVLLNTLNPMPEDIFEFVNTIEKRKKIELIIEEALRNVSYEEYEKSLVLFKIVSPGCIDTAYLKPGFDNYFFHINDDLYIFYDCETEDNIWTANKGIIKVNYNDFVNEFKLFVNNFMNDMEKRIDEVCSLLKEDLIDLKKEHRERLSNFDDMFKKIESGYNVEFDEWDNIIKLAKKHKVF